MTTAVKSQEARRKAPVLTKRRWNLSELDIFADVPRRQIDELAGTLRITEYKKREPILLAQDDPDRVFLVVSGRVKICRVDRDTGKEIIFYILEPGELFGPLTSEKDWHSDSMAVALEPSLVATIALHAFNGLAKNPVFSNQLNKIMAARLARVERRLEELTFRPVASRLARLLLRLSKNGASRTSSATADGVKLTQQDIANLIGATREITSLTLNEFQRQGWIRLRPGRVSVCKPRALKEMAN